MCPWHSHASLCRVLCCTGNRWFSDCSPAVNKSGLGGGWFCSRCCLVVLICKCSISEQCNSLQMNNNGQNHLLAASCWSMIKSRPPTIKTLNFIILTYSSYSSAYEKPQVSFSFHFSHHLWKCQSIRVRHCHCAKHSGDHLMLFASCRAGWFTRWASECSVSAPLYKINDLVLALFCHQQAKGACPCCLHLSPRGWVTRQFLQHVFTILPCHCSCIIQYILFLPLLVPGKLHLLLQGKNRWTNQLHWRDCCHFS